MELQPLILCVILCLTPTIRYAFGQIDLAKVVMDAKEKLDQLKQSRGLTNASILAIETAKQGMTIDVMRSITILLTLAKTLKQDQAYPAGSIKREINGFLGSVGTYLKSVVSRENQAVIDTAARAILANGLEKALPELKKLADKLKKDSTIPDDVRKILEAFTQNYNSIPLSTQKASFKWRIDNLLSLNTLSRETREAIEKARKERKEDGDQAAYFLAVEKAINKDPSIPDKAKEGIAQVSNVINKLINKGNSRKTSLTVIILGTAVSMIIFSSI